MWLAAASLLGRNARRVHEPAQALRLRKSAAPAEGYGSQRPCTCINISLFIICDTVQAYKQGRQEEYGWPR